MDHLQNIKLAASWIEHGAMVRMEQGEIKKAPFASRIKYLFDATGRKREVDAVIAHAGGLLDEITRETALHERVATFKLAESLITHFKNDRKYSQQLIALDRQMVEVRVRIWPRQPVRPSDFHHPVVQKGYQRWLKYGFDPKVYREYPHFSQFIIKTGLASCMATWGASVVIDKEIPCIRYEGE